MKQVQESLYHFRDAKFFNSLFEEEKLSPADKKKMAGELQRQGMSVIKKCINNFSAFRKNAGDIWQEYRDFWSSQKEADESVQQKGLFYNLWESDYIVGVVKEPNGKAMLKVFNTSAVDTDEYVAFQTSNPDVVKAFQEFIKNDLEFTMKTIVEKQKAAMVAKKAADKARAKEESAMKKKARLDSFLGESAKSKKKLNEDHPDLGVPGVKTWDEIGLSGDKLITFDDGHTEKFYYFDTEDDLDYHVSFEGGEGVNVYRNEDDTLEAKFSAYSESGNPDNPDWVDDDLLSVGPLNPMHEGMDFGKLHSKVLIDLEKKKIGKQVDANRDKIRALLNNDGDPEEILQLRDENYELNRKWEDLHSQWQS